MANIINNVVLLGARSTFAPLESVPEELSSLKSLFKKCNIILEYEPYLTKEILKDILQNIRNKADIIHFSGHTNEDTLQTDKELIHTKKVTEIINTWDRKPLLVFFNGCANSKQVTGLLNAGVEYVIATHNYIDDKLAASFSYEFYNELISNTSITKAFNRAGSISLLDKSEHARSIFIAENINKNKWDWGLFSRKNVVEDIVYFPKRKIRKNHFLKYALFMCLALLLFYYYITSTDQTIEITLTPYHGYAFVNPPLIELIKTNNDECNTKNKNFFNKMITNCTNIDIGSELIYKLEVCLRKELSISDISSSKIIEKLVKKSNCLKLEYMDESNRLISIDKSRLKSIADRVVCSCD